jgi:hypothetical protein
MHMFKLLCDYVQGTLCSERSSNQVLSDVPHRSELTTAGDSTMLKHLKPVASHQEVVAHVKLVL